MLSLLDLFQGPLESKVQAFFRPKFRPFPSSFLQAFSPTKQASTQGPITRPFSCEPDHGPLFLLHGLPCRTKRLHACFFQPPLATACLLPSYNHARLRPSISSMTTTRACHLGTNLSPAGPPHGMLSPHARTLSLTHVLPRMAISQQTSLQNSRSGLPVSSHAKTHVSRLQCVFCHAHPGALVPKP